MGVGFKNWRRDQNFKTGWGGVSKNPKIKKILFYSGLVSGQGQSSCAFRTNVPLELLPERVASPICKKDVYYYCKTANWDTLGIIDS
jgi:hypothetical protein